MDLKEESILGSAIESHWYYVSKGRAMRDFLGDLKAPQTLDVGAGSGIFSRQLLDLGLCDSAVCVDPNYADERSEEHHGKEIRFVRSVEGTRQKLLLMMDVLEHIDDDVGFLREYASSLEAGGHILITVPAFQFMWSGHDVFLEHRRRYTISSLEAVINQAGLIPLKSRYFFGSLFPAIAALRLLKRLLIERGVATARSDLKVYSHWTNELLIRLHDMERRSVFAFNRLFGLSIFCICSRA
jgi:SAM-dependent methyltransferase